VDIIELPVASIRRHPQQIRKEYARDGIEGLARSIEEVGLLQPVLVKESAGGYQLVAGERRLQAAEWLGRESIHAIVLAPGVAVRQVQLTENLQREDLNPVERARAVHEFMVMEKLTKVAAARRLGVPRTTLTDWLDVLDVSERYQRALVNNFHGGDSPLTLSHISEAKGLAVRLRSPAICNKLLDAVLEYRLSKAETREVCALVREGTDVSVEEAVALVRRPSNVHKLAKDEEDGRMAVERNIEKWVTALERSAHTLTELRRVAPRHLSVKERERILRQLREVERLISETVRHVAVEEVLPGAPRAS
jgi:ParB family chromosome partitioning protein